MVENSCKTITYVCGQVLLSWYILLVQPSSASSERVFNSLLNSSFKDQQDCSLQDYVEPLSGYNTTNVK